MFLEMYLLNIVAILHKKALHRHMETVYSQ